MSLQHNLLASLVSQIYVTLIGVLLVPLYLEYMGAEAYGLVGFFTMLQMWFGLLDAGLTPTLSRETARHRDGTGDNLRYRQLVRVLEILFIAIALAGGLAITAGAHWIASSWLKSSILPLSQIEGAIQLMGPIFALRWMCGLYRGALTGAERLVWLSGFNAIVATLRFAGVLPLLLLYDPTPIVFFSFQLLVAVCETAVLVFCAYRQFPKVATAIPWLVHWAPLRSVLGFATSVAFTSSVWVLVTQTDKLVLSRVLPLTEYAHFTLAVLVAGAVTMLSGPIGTAVTPRLARLEAEGATEAFVRTYRDTTQLVAIVAGSVALTFAYQADSLLWAWTGDVQTTNASAPILAWYALGNGVMSFAAFQYYLQFSKGDMRLHIVGSIGFVVLYVPVVILASQHWGGEGAAWAWLGTNLVTLIAWVPFVHRRFIRGLNKVWILQDVLPITVIASAVGWFVSASWQAGDSRLMALFGVFAVGFSCMLAGAFASTAAHRRAREWWHARRSAKP